MTIEELKAFVLLAEEQHFGRAAEQLHVSRSALTRLIKSLESDLQTPLFIRTTRRVALTAAGKVLAEGAPEVLAGVEWLAEQVRSASTR